MRHCSVCGRELAGSGQSLNMAGVPLQNLCWTCHDLGASDPKKLVSAHRDVFAHMLAERKAILFGETIQERSPLMNTKYDPGILEKYADSLYSLAYQVIAQWVLIGAAVGAGIAYLYVSFQRAPQSMEIMVFGAAVGGVLGGIWGSRKAFVYKLWAQAALCFLQIEKNTRYAAEKSDRLAEIELNSSRLVDKTERLISIESDKNIAHAS